MRDFDYTDAENSVLRDRLDGCKQSARKIRSLLSNVDMKAEDREAIEAELLYISTGMRRRIA